MGGSARTGPVLTSDQLQLAADLLEGGKRLIEVFPCVRGRDLATDPRLSLRHHWVPKAGHEYTLPQEQVTHADRSGGLTQNDRNDRGLARKRLEPETEQLVAEVARVPPERLDPLRMGLE